MHPTRRQVLAGAGAGLSAGVAGCAGELTGEGAAFGAAEASLSARVQADTGYGHHRTRNEPITESFQVFGFSRSVEVTNVVAEYDRAVELGPLGLGRIQAAVFAVLSTPQVRILTRTFNPVGDMSTAEIAGLLQEHYDGIDDVREDASTPMRVAGETATVTRFTASARLVSAGVGLDVYLYVSEAVRAGDDFLVCLAVHPQVVGTAEETVQRLCSGVEH